MGYLIEYKGKDGKRRFTAMYRDLKGVPRSAGTFATAKQAGKAWQKAENDQTSGRIGDPTRGRQTIAKYVSTHWFPEHLIELSTRQSYTYLLDRYILPELGPMQIGHVMPSDVRSWVLKLQRQGVNPPTIRQCKVILDAIFTTALNDQITYLHAGRGVKIPPTVKKPRQVITAEQFDRIYSLLPEGTMRLLVETDIESGLRWGELTELRVKDLDFATGMLTVARVVVKLSPKFHPTGGTFHVKDYPKDKEWRTLKLAPHLVAKILKHAEHLHLAANDLLFEFEQATEARRRSRPDTLPDPETLGWADPDAKGRRYRHGTTSAYAASKCRCQYCRDAVATYRAERRMAGKDTPRKPKTVATDGHIGNDWFRVNVWNKALREANLGFRVTPHGLRHAHASWLLAGGADIQVVKERLGHGSISTTAKYLHTLPGADDVALNALTAIRGDRSAPSQPPASTCVEADAHVADKDQRIRDLEAKLAKFKALIDG